MKFGRSALVISAVTMGMVAAAEAQPRQGAEIVYAGQGGASRAAPAPMRTAALETSVQTGLAGGDDNSYGYGGGRTRSEAPVVDLRRANRTPAAAEEGAPSWLERERVGPPYEANGRWYAPTPEPGYEMVGQASWYGPTFHGQPTASGEIFDQEAISAAHPTLPIPSLVQVTNLENGREIIVRVNDRGPFVDERLIDLSRRAAEVLGFEAAGQARVHVRYLGPAPRHVNADGAAAAPSRTLPAAAQPPAETFAAADVDGPLSLRPPEEAPRLAAPAPAAVQTVALPAPSPSAAPAGAYFVQVGAFADLMNAHRVRAEVEAAGPVVVDTRQTARGELFRVRVGPLASPADAETARRTLADLGYNDTILAAR